MRPESPDFYDVVFVFTIEQHLYSFIQRQYYFSDLVPHILAGHVNLAQIAASMVLPCMMQPNCHRVLVRRCCLFLGETSMLLAGLDMDLYFRALFQALTHADAAVALAACSAITSSIEVLCSVITSSIEVLDATTGHRNLAAFLPFLPGVIEQLVKLLHALEKDESKTKILKAISVTIGQTGASAAHLASDLISAFPQIWNSVRNCPTTQPHCLMLATTLVNCARVAVAPHVPALCSLIALTVNVSDASTLTIRDFALDTWLAIMRNITAYTEELHKLFEHLIPFMLEGHCEHIKTVVRILDSYLLLGGATFASVYSTTVLQGLSSILQRDLKDSAVILISQSVQVMFVAFPEVTGTDSAWEMCCIIAKCFVAHLATMPDQTSLVLASLCGVLARYCFLNPQKFLLLRQHLGKKHKKKLMKVRRTTSLVCYFTLYTSPVTLIADNVFFNETSLASNI